MNHSPVVVECVIIESIVNGLRLMHFPAETESKRGAFSKLNAKIKSINTSVSNIHE